MKVTPGKTLDIWASDTTVLHITEAKLPIYTRRNFIVSVEKISGIYIIQRMIDIDYMVRSIHQALKDRDEKLPRNFKKWLANELKTYFNE